MKQLSSTFLTNLLGCLLGYFGFHQTLGRFRPPLTLWFWKALKGSASCLRSDRPLIWSVGLFLSPCLFSSLFPSSHSLLLRVLFLLLLFSSSSCGVFFFFLFVIKADDCVACLFFLTTAQWSAGEWDCARKRMGCFHCGEGLAKGSFEIENEDDRNVKISLNLAAYTSGYFSIMPVLCRVEECLQLGAVPWHLKHLYSSCACAWKPKRGNALGHRSTIISLARLWPWSLVPFWPGPASTSQTALRASPGACAGPVPAFSPTGRWLLCFGGCQFDNVGVNHCVLLVSRPKLPTLLILLE